jgi:hypothetical protein
MVEISVAENHKSSCTALKTLFRGWYAYVVLVSGKKISGIVEDSETGGIKIDGEEITEKDPIQSYKPVRFN